MGALCLLLALLLIGTLMAPAGPIGGWQYRLAEPIAPAQRSAIFAASDPFVRSGLGATAPITVTALSLTLFGTRQSPSGSGGSAILAGSDGVQQSYAVGSEIQPGVTLTRVAFDHVVITRNGTEESLFMDQSKPADNVGGSSGSPAMAQAAPSGPAAASGADGEVRFAASAIQQAVSVSPRQSGGRVTGLIVAPRGDGDLLRSIGLQAGDVISAINGRPVSAVGDIASALQPGSRVTLEVERGAQKIAVGISLE